MRRISDRRARQSVISHCIDIDDVGGFFCQVHGSHNLLNSIAANFSPASAPIDMALNNSSRYLYVHGGGLQAATSPRRRVEG